MENEYNKEVQAGQSEYFSPLKIVVFLRNLIFGKESPALILRIPIYINILCWFIFQTWHILSFFAISFRDVILQEKKINVEILILKRGSELNFDPSVFLNHLLNFHLLACLCFALFFIGIILMWRQLKFYAIFIFVPMLVYVIAQLFYMGFNYYNEDITFFDKILFFILICNSVFFAIMFNKEKSETGGDFFNTETEIN